MCRRRLLWAVTLLVGCTETYAHFSPYSVQSASARKVMKWTIQVYEGDVPTLVQAGGQILGTLEVSGNGYADNDEVRARAQYDAADYGGTHLLIAGEHARTTWAQVTPTTASTTVQGNTAYTTVTPGAEIPVTRHSGTYLVVRVPPEPPAIRPIQGRHFDGPYPGQRTISGPPGSAP